MVIRSSMEYSSDASRDSRDISPDSSSAIKPTVPMLTPKMGMPRRMASLELWRMVPSPPKQISASAVLISSWRSDSTTFSGRGKLGSTSKARQIFTSTPEVSKMRRASRTQEKSRSR